MSTEFTAQPVQPTPPGQTGQPQPVQVPPPSPPVQVAGYGTPRKSRDGRKFFVFGLLAVILFILGFAAAILILKPQPQTLVLASPTPETQASEAPIQATSHAFAYLKNNNIFVYSVDKQAEQQITTDGTAQQAVWYRQVKLVDENTLGFVRCERQGGTTEKDPYSCSLQRKTISGGTAETLVTLQSTPNSNGYQIGGEFSAYEWNQAKNKLAYLTYVPVDDSVASKSVELKLHTIGQGADVTLETYAPNAGRGGSLDDEVAIHFSPNGDYLLLIDTMLETPYVGEEKGTVFVYDLKNNQRVWSEPNAVTTFGSWSNENTLIAKQRQRNNQQAYLISVSFPDKAIRQLATVSEWYDIENASGKAYYWKLASGTGKGIELRSFDTTTQEDAFVKANVFKVKVLGDGQIAVRMSKPCTPVDSEGGCGMDIFNGIEAAHFGVLNPDTGTIQEFTLDTTGVFEVDVR